MLIVYVPRGNSLERLAVEEAGSIPDNAIWFDLVNPTAPEDKLLERALGIAIPTREEMQEIEVTSRLYVENGARYMTATLMCQSDTDTPKTTAVTFILAGHRLRTPRRHLHPGGPPARHGALRRAASVHDRRQQACPDLLAGRERRVGADGPAR